MKLLEIIIKEHFDQEQIIERKSFLPKQLKNLSVNTTKQGTTKLIVWNCDDSYYFLILLFKVAEVNH